MKHMRLLILTASTFAFPLVIGIAAPAAAHPDEPDTITELLEKSKALADKARKSGDAIVDSDMISNMSDLLSDLADRIEVERGAGSGTALWIDGDEIIRFNGENDKVLSVTGVGKNLTVDREIIIKDGKTRTRIVIEMDDGQDAQINMLPQSNSPE